MEANPDTSLFLKGGSHDIFKRRIPLVPPHRCARPSSFRLLLSSLMYLFIDAASSADSLPGVSLSAAAASAKSWAPSVSASPSTRVLTVAPSLLFLPSRRLDAIFSMKSHSRPEAMILPVFGSRGAIHSGATRKRGGTFAFFDLTVYTIPSSSKRWYEFLSVCIMYCSQCLLHPCHMKAEQLGVLTSLFTASK